MRVRAGARAIACACHNNGGKMFHAFEINLPNDRQLREQTGEEGEEQQQANATCRHVHVCVFTLKYLALVTVIDLNNTVAATTSTTTIRTIRTTSTTT